MVSPVSTAVRHQQARRPRGLRRYFSNIRRAVTSTFEGISVTMSWMFRRPMTIQYPDRIEKPVQEMLPENYRGVLEVDLDRCTGCLLCAKACPLGCIDISVCKNPATNEREFEKFDIDIGLCMYCGICAETCNFDALVHTSQFEATVSSPDQLTLKFVREPGQKVSKHKANEGPARKPRGSILREVIPGFGRRRAADRTERPADTKEAAAGSAAEEETQSPAPPAPRPAGEVVSEPAGNPEKSEQSGQTPQEEPKE